MRRAVAGLLCLALAAGAAPLAMAQEVQQPSVADVIAAVSPYTSTWDSVPNDIAGLTAFADGLLEARAQYQSWRTVLQAEATSLQTQVDTLAGAVEQLQAQEAELGANLAAAQVRQAEQERTVGALARLLYQQPAPEWSAIEQMLEGSDLRSFDRQSQVSQVLTSNTAQLEAIRAEVASLQQQLDVTRTDLAGRTNELATVSQRREATAGRLAVVADALTAIEADQQRVAEAIDVIRAEEDARLRAQAAAAAAAAAQEAAGGVTAARPTGGGTPANSSDKFSALLPAAVPYRDVFLTYGIRYRVEPALLAAIASQESGFNPNAGCNRVGAGKGIMQHENQSAYCGPAAVEASVEKAAIMIASYYNRSDSWTAAIFAYNNGPGLMDEWVQHSADRDEFVQVVGGYYNAQSYARPGPMQGYASWGEWRAHVAYNYAAPTPEPGFHSVTQKWLIYRQG